MNINTKRVRQINDVVVSEGSVVVYWMTREHRVEDNWTLLYALTRAKELKHDLVVVFSLRRSFPNATLRMLDYMLRGLEEVAEKLAEKGIKFFFELGDPGEVVPAFSIKHKASLLVTDFSPLHINQKWCNAIASNITIPFYEVDSRNVVPVWTASSKQEFGAYTLRPKLHKLLPEFLDDFPKVPNFSKAVSFYFSPDKILKQIEFDDAVVVSEYVPGCEAGMQKFKNFLHHTLTLYGDKRNDPLEDAQSGLSPYLHFGHISAQRICLGVMEYVNADITEILHQQKNKAKIDTERPLELIDHAGAFIEELVVRRELAENFCFYNPHYDTIEGFPEWAKQSHAEHSKDARDFVYSLKQFEHGKTHDELWNAAQMEMVKTGKMHGYMRMYWAKKILEWTESPEVAMKIAIYLNDKYELDGRDPNGYAGIAWSIGGVHDRAWFTRPVFGKVRYMNANGAASKFNTKAYIANWL